MLRFYGLRILRDYLGHIILIGLPVVLISINTYLATQNGQPQAEVAMFVGLVYILMFQVFGAAYTFEGIEHDFYTPFRNRLRAAPVHPMRFVVSNLAFSTLTSFVQSMVIMIYAVTVFGARYVNWWFVVMVFFVGVVFAQVLAAVLIMLLKKASKAQAMITMYAIFGTLAAGLFVPFPENRLTIFLERFSSPIAWSRTSIYAFMSRDYQEGLIFFGMLIGATLLAGFALLKLSKRVTT